MDTFFHFNLNKYFSFRIKFKQYYKKRQYFGIFFLIIYHKQSIFNKKLKNKIKN